MEDRRVRRETALNLSLGGMVGSFSIGAGRSGQRSLGVKYFLTHVSLDFGDGANEALLKHLAPVREMFDFKDLEFDEIMQRDIDDARVSGELIPYLLDERSHDIIKLFPPIIVVVLPTAADSNSPARFYPKLEEERIEPSAREYGKQILRAGDVGSEVFAIEQALDGERVIAHDYARLRLNTNRTKMVIVDGQHRAMALLALYRNLKGDWGDSRRAPYRFYYQEWTGAYIRSFNLQHINLPVMFCTFPELVEGYEGEYDLPRASREVFLTLNKTARKVSSTRNILLNDSDLIAHFLRRVLSEIKNRDQLSPAAARIHSVELDQAADRQRLSSPVAVTGVSHIYYAIEHMMLSVDGDVLGIKARSGKYFKRMDLDAYGLMARLDGRNILGGEEAGATKRDIFRKKSARLLGDAFMKSHGASVLRLVESFPIYELHNRSVLALSEKLIADGKERLRPIFFEGQGNERVFQAHRSMLKERYRAGQSGATAPEIKVVLEQLDATEADLRRYVEFLRNLRALEYLKDVRNRNELMSDNGELNHTVRSFIDALFSNVFTTVAFQCAVLAEYWSVLEKSDGLGYEDATFDELLGGLDAVLRPRSVAGLAKIVALFRGEFARGENGEWSIAPTIATFKNVVYKGEMQPDQWPKLRILVLEAWQPTDARLAEVVQAHRLICRRQVFGGLYEDRLRQKAAELGVGLDAIDEGTQRQVFDESYVSFTAFLGNLGVAAADRPSRAAARQFRLADEDAELPDNEIDGEPWGDEAE